jgi:hypothetical protein
MKWSMKKLKLLFFSAVFFAFIIAFKVSAQAPPAQPSQSWRCLRGEQQAFTFNGAGNTTLTQDLYADGYPLNIDAYVVTCVGTQGGATCTTTDPDYDNLIFGADNTKSFPYSVSIEGGSKQKTELGKINTKATVATAGLSGGVGFYSVTIDEPEDIIAEGLGMKQGTNEFINNVTADCVSISWTTVVPPTRSDPFGIIFDSQSLEPLPDVKVTVLDTNKKLYTLIGLTNPQTTKADGLFNFLVAPGTYYLTVSEPKGYAFTSTPKLNPNYIKIYHKADGTNSIYKPNEQIVEEIDTPEEIKNKRPNIEHRDIPLDPGTNKPYDALPSTITYKMTHLGNVTKIEGKVSHPFTDVSFSQGGVLISKVKANRFGEYKVIIEDAKLEQDEDIVVLYTKVDLTKLDIIEISSSFISTQLQTINKFLNSFISVLLSSFSSPSFAQSTIRISSPTKTFSLSPILSYIEGYAYDKDNNILPLSRIYLKLNMNNASIYETKADEKGYFVILPKYIPIFPYYLKIIPQNGGVPVIYTPSAFAKKNKEYLSDNKINLVEGTKNNKPLASNSPTLTQSEVTSADQQNSKDSVSKSLEAEKKTKVSSMLFLVFVIFIFFILIGLTVFFIIKNKNNRPLS